MALRDEFEPLLISPFGLHKDANLCLAYWGNEEGCPAEFERAWEWLQLWPRTKKINRSAGTSYGLKHAAERWHRNKRSGDPYISNGHLIMAAHRLGFAMEGIPANYCGPGPREFTRDICNVWLNISKRANGLDVPRAAGTRNRGAS
jgi:hypothetical protein